MVGEAAQGGDRAFGHGHRNTSAHGRPIASLALLIRADLTAKSSLFFRPTEPDSATCSENRMLDIRDRPLVLAHPRSPNRTNGFASNQ